jgi:hypothetical protein
MDQADDSTKQQPLKRCPRCDSPDLLTVHSEDDSIGQACPACLWHTPGFERIRIQNPVAASLDVQARALDFFLEQNARMEAQIARAVCAVYGDEDLDRRVLELQSRIAKSSTNPQERTTTPAHSAKKKGRGRPASKKLAELKRQLEAILRKDPGMMAEDVRTELAKIIGEKRAGLVSDVVITRARNRVKKQIS